MSSIPQLLVLILPLILAGVLNMVFVKAPLLHNLRTPMDGGATWKDGRRIFGDNKTWKGFVGMILTTSLCLWLFEFLAKASPSMAELSLLPFESWSPPFNGVFWGAIWGLAYVVAELPNSFIKRRIEIPPGQNVSGFKGKIFMVVDQVDSSFGCAVALCLAIPMTVLDVLAVAALGGLFHYLFAVLLFYVGLKKQRG